MQRISFGRFRYALRVLLFGAAFLTALPCSSSAAVFLAKDEALSLAFPAGTTVEQRTILLSDQQKAVIEARAHSKLESNLVTFYEGRSNGQITGYAVIDSRIMRTMRAAFMVVLSPDQTVEKVVILAFNEPPEYMPSGGWLKRLEGAQPVEELIPGRGLPLIAGSTLSVQGIADGVRAVRESLSVALTGK